MAGGADGSVAETYVPDAVVAAVLQGLKHKYFKGYNSLLFKQIYKKTHRKLENGEEEGGRDLKER